ncbi:hypothetical protein JOQ06_000466, partial [Pogonophryne albipinna]
SKQANRSPLNGYGLIRDHPLHVPNQKKEEGVRRRQDELQTENGPDRFYEGSRF